MKIKYFVRFTYYTRTTWGNINLVEDSIILELYENEINMRTVRYLCEEIVKNKFNYYTINDILLITKLT